MRNSSSAEMFRDLLLCKQTKGNSSSAEMFRDLLLCEQTMGNSSSAEMLRDTYAYIYSNVKENNSLDTNGNQSKYVGCLYNRYMTTLIIDNATELTK
jgi:hypothetical protein